MSATISRKLSHYDALWADHCNGHTTIAALARRHRLTYAAAAELLQAFRDWRREEQQEGMDAREQYAAGLEWDLRAAADIYGTLTSETSRLNCLKHITSLREKLALARGVPTVVAPECPRAVIQAIAIPLFATEDPFPAGIYGAQGLHLVEDDDEEQGSAASA